jgi:long-subunit fatty acid transport protein
MMLDSPGVAYSSTTDYVNWKDTHRVTCGVGYKVAGWNFDLAYQYNMTKGDFYPMQQFESGQSVGMTNVNFKRHQVLLTLGYTF